ncbi:hypothetical protein HZB88_02045 [archaeon]|nr:hypothetical protein [archaeon]
MSPSLKSLKFTAYFKLTAIAFGLLIGIGAKAVEFGMAEHNNHLYTKGAISSKQLEQTINDIGDITFPVSLAGVAIAFYGISSYAFPKRRKGIYETSAEEL